MFKQDKGMIVVDTDVIGAVPAFKVMWNRDVSEGKEFAIAKMQIIWHLHNPNSPYATSSLLNRMTTIVMDLFERNKVCENKTVMEWFDKYYVSKFVNPERKKQSVKKQESAKPASKNAKPVKEEKPEEPREIPAITDENFERAAKQYREFLNLIPQYKMLESARTAVHKLADKIADPKTQNPEDLLVKMNKALKDLKDMEELVKAEEDKAISTRGGHDVRKREDPSYLLGKFQANPTKTMIPQ